MRKCDPGANDRMPIDRASQSWDHDRQIDCFGQSSGQRAPSWLFVNMHDSLRRSPSVDGVEPQVGDEPPIACAKLGCDANARGSARHRLHHRQSSRALADFGRPDIRNVKSRFGSVRASGRILAFFCMSKRFISLGRLITTSPVPDRRSTNVGHLNGNVGAATCLRNSLCTHSLIRVSDEKRNADECSATRGKPNCHR